MFLSISLLVVREDTHLCRIVDEKVFFIYFIEFMVTLDFTQRPHTVLILCSLKRKKSEEENKKETRLNMCISRLNFKVKSFFSRLYGQWLECWGLMVKFDHERTRVFLYSCCGNMLESSSTAESNHSVFGPLSNTFPLVWLQCARCSDNLRNGGENIRSLKEAYDAVPYCRTSLQAAKTKDSERGCIVVEI